MFQEIQEDKKKGREMRGLCPHILSRRWRAAGAGPAATAPFHFKGLAGLSICDPETWACCVFLMNACPGIVRVASIDGAK